MMAENRGSTLAEMVIVMAIVSIMSVMVVSFTIMCNGWVRLGIDQYHLTLSERSAETALRFFVSKFDDSDYYFVSDSITLAVRSHDDETIRYAFGFSNGVVSYVTPDGEGSYPLDCVKNAYFLIQENPITKKQLILFRLIYELPAISNSAKTVIGEYSISVCSRATEAPKLSEESFVFSETSIPVELSESEGTG